MEKVRTATIASILLAVTVCLSGCGDKFMDPTQIGRFRPVPVVNVILDSLGVAEETPSTWEGAEDPKPIDVMSFETDYVFSPGDFVRISIFELFQAGVPFVNDYVVTETGKISIPEVGTVDAAGLTESELEEEIARILSPTILKDPSVTVILLDSQKRSFSIAGNGIPRPGRYNIPRYDFRLLDALAVAGGINQFNASYVYVSRAVTGREPITELVEPEPVEPGPAEPQEAEQLIEDEEEMLETIAPRAQRQWPANRLIITSAEMITNEELAEAALPEGFEALTSGAEPRTEAEDILPAVPQSGQRETIEEPIGVDQRRPIEWIFQDGKWVPVQVGEPRPAPRVKIEPGKLPVDEFDRPLREEIPEEFDWEQTEGAGIQRRVIKIPTDKLTGGDPRYNVVVRPSDDIQVPVDIIGEFSIYGNVNLQGFINITGRPMTLKQAIAAAGGLGPLAWPKRVEVVRRIGKNKEETVMVNLDKIARGEQPDFFIKPNDWINVGTHPTARWRAVLRNAFRATYGFGFIYDRNFADRDFGTSRPFGSIYDHIEDIF